MFEVWLQMSDTNIDTENPSDLPALTSTVFIHINAPQGDAVFKIGRGAIKNQLSSPVAMDNNGHFQPCSCLPLCTMVRDLKILETHLKFEEIIKFISYFCMFHCVCDENCHVWF